MKATFLQPEWFLEYFTKSKYGGIIQIGTFQKNQ